MADVRVKFHVNLHFATIEFFRLAICKLNLEAKMATKVRKGYITLDQLIEARKVIGVTS